jgi:hypothetical protein
VRRPSTTSTRVSASRAQARSNTRISAGSTPVKISRPGLAGRRAVACSEHLACDVDPPARDVDPRVATLGHDMLDPLTRAEQARVEPGVGVDPQGPLAALGIDDEPERARSLGLAEGALLVARLETSAVGHDPDLQEVHGHLLRGVVLAVGHASARAHPLDFAGPDHRAVAHRVTMLELPVEHVRDDLHVTMRMRTKPPSRLDAVFIDHP